MSDNDKPKNPLREKLPKVPPASPKDPDAAPPIPGEPGTDD